MGRRPMTDIDKRNLIAQWAFDARPVLLRFHLWLEDVEVERSQANAVSDHAFAPRGIARCLAMTSAATALGTRLFGGFGEGAGRDKATYNQVKKAADAISAYVMSEGLWHLTRSLPENHAIMVSLGEGLMPKAGETPEMGANPLLGFGRVYARPEVASMVDCRIRRLLNEPGHTFDQFHDWLRGRGITLWGAAVDTLENTSRFAEGKETGPMVVIHLFDSPLVLSRPYESYMGCLTIPRFVADAADWMSLLLDYRTPRTHVVEAVEAAYRGIRRQHIHVWTLRGKSRVARLGALWEEWTALGVHLVEDGWVTPAGYPIFTDSGTYAPTFLVGSWTDADGATHVFLCDGYAATAEAMQAASLSEVLDVDCSMALFSPTFDQPCHVEGRLMQLDPDAPEFARRVAELLGGCDVEAGKVQSYADAIREAVASNLPMDRAASEARRLPAAEAVERARVHRLHLRRPVHRHARRRTARRRNLPRHHRPGDPPGGEPDLVHVPIDGAARSGEAHLQPAAGPVHLGRGSHDAACQNLGLGPHPQRAADDAVTGARIRRGHGASSFRSPRRTGRAARQAGDHPPRPDLVSRQPPGVVRLARHRLSAKAKRKGRRST